MASDEVKLLGSWQSPFALRARIALNIKSVGYEFQQENVLFSKSDLLLQSNPIHKKIPVLIHNHNPICESLIIIQYIDESWPSAHSILPSHPYDRALARFWASYIDDTWFNHLKASLSAEGEEAKKTQEETIKGLIVLEEAFTKCDGGGKFFGGEKIGYVDIALGCFLAWIKVINKVHGISLIDESNTPNLLKWAQNFCADPAVKDIMADTEELYEFAKILVSAMKASAAPKPAASLHENAIATLPKS